MFMGADEALCQWCVYWARDRRGAMGTCDVPRRVRLRTEPEGAKGGAPHAVVRRLRIATHADDGCGQFVEKPGVFGPAPQLGGHETPSHTR